MQINFDKISLMTGIAKIFAEQAGAVVGQFFEGASKYLKGINTQDINWVVIIFLFALLVLFLIGVAAGKSRMLVALISIYIARFIEMNFIYFDDLNNLFSSIPKYILHVGLFAVFFMAVFLLFQRTALRGRLSLADVSIFSSGILSFFMLGFLLSIIIGYLPSNLLTEVPSTILNYFDDKVTQFWWATAPIVSLILLRKKHRHYDIGSDED